MSSQQHEAHEQRLLLLVETAQRAGHTEREITDLVDDAVKVDDDVERAA